MRLVQLKYFMEVAQSGSINHTAQKLFATQQTVNAALKRLEDEVGYPLLERSSAGVTLTKHGEIFLPFAKKTMEQYAEVCQALESVHQPEEKRWRGYCILAMPRLWGKSFCRRC